MKVNLIKRHHNMVILILLLSITFLLLQIYLYLGVKNKKAISDQALHSLDYHTLENLGLFSSLCLLRGLPVFVIDPRILRILSSSSTGSKPGDCQHLCTGSDLTTLGIQSQAWSYNDDILRTLTDQGFQYIYYTEKSSSQVPDASQGKLKSVTLYTHYIFHRHGHSIHLVLFYERRPGFWWFGQIAPPDHHEDVQVHGDVGELPLQLRDLALGHWPGIIDRIKQVKVSLDGINLRVPANPKLVLDQLGHSHFIECNHARARAFREKHGLDDTAEALAFKEEAREVLKIGAEVLDKLAVPFWLSSGTCLGWFRQCDIIPYSQDVDLGIRIKDYRPEIVPAMAAHGMPILHSFGLVNDSYELSFQGGNVKLDIFFFYEEGDIMWNGATQLRTANKYKYNFGKFDLCWTEFLQLKVRVPCDTLTYIHANYGDEWSEPVKEWDWKKSPPNVVENGQWPESLRDKAIQTFRD